MDGNTRIAETVRRVPWYAKPPMSLLVRGAKAYWYVFSVLAIAALAAAGVAWIAGLAAWAAGASDPERQQRILSNWGGPHAQHIAWVVGAVVAAIGQAFGWVKLRFEGWEFSFSEDDTAAGAADAASPGAIEKAPVAMRERLAAVKITRDSLGRALGHAGHTGFYGGIVVFLMSVLLGVMLGVVFISYALSPWGPPEMAAAVVADGTVPYSSIVYTVILGIPAVAAPLLFIGAFVESLFS